MATSKLPHSRKPRNAVTLKAVATHLGLTPGTVSAVLNNSAAARSIPEHTRKRILAAARELNYRPNFLARSLRVQRTFTIGVIAEEIGDAYGGMVVNGIEAYLSEKNYFFFTVAHRHDPRLLQTYSEMLLARGIEGLITIDTSIAQPPVLPTVAVAGHQRADNVTNIILDHRRAAELGLRHLEQLGHTRIAFLKGQEESSDSATRWRPLKRSPRNSISKSTQNWSCNSKAWNPLLRSDTPAAKLSSPAACLSRRFSRTTTFLLLAQCAHFRRPATAYRKIYPLWDLTTWHWRLFRFRHSPRFASHY